MSVNYIPKINPEQSKIQALVIFTACFSAVYFIVLSFSHKQELSVFVATFATLLLLFVFANRALESLRTLECESAEVQSSDEAVSEKAEHTIFPALERYREKDTKRLQFVLNISGEGLWEWNMRTGEITFNAQFQEIVGIHNTEYGFKDFEESIFEEDKERVGNAIHALIEHNEPYDLEFRIIRPDGKVIWVWDRCGIVEFENDQPVWMIGIVQDITEAKINQERIRRLAYYDPLTTLANRTLFEEKLSNLLQERDQEREYSALLLLDLDLFKLLNETYGYQVGDEVLSVVAERLDNEVGAKGSVARFEGDKFAILLPHLNDISKLAIAYSQKFSERISLAVSEPVKLKESCGIDVDYSVSASVGGMVFNSAEASAENLIRLTESALRRAKGNSGHGIRVFGPESRLDLDRASVLKKAVHKAYAEKEFTTYLQPRYNSSQEMTGGEILLRWLHPTMGALAPRAFLDIAEETNLIVPLGHMVLEKACQLLQEWQSAPETEHLNISVNLSSKQIWHSKFVSDFYAIIDKYPVDKSKLTLEVSESTFLKDIDETVSKLSDVKKFGVKLSLGNFGTGYSSLSNLLKLPVDEIKIDRSIIKDIFIDKQSHLMVQSIMSMADFFQLDVVVEGVETEAQLALLQDYESCLFQGFLFEMPMPLEKFQSEFTL